MAYVPPKLPSTGTGKTKSVVRGQNDETASLRIPTPEDLGIGAPTGLPGHEPLDWTLVERKLDRAGVTAFRVEKTAGGFQCTCDVPTGSVSGRGGSKSAAVRQALAQLR
jgi:hypothetical protein